MIIAFSTLRSLGIDEGSVGVMQTFFLPDYPHSDTKNVNIHVQHEDWVMSVVDRCPESFVCYHDQLHFVSTLWVLRLGFRVPCDRYQCYSGTLVTSRLDSASESDESFRYEPRHVIVRLVVRSKSFHDLLLLWQVYTWKKSWQWSLDRCRWKARD